MISSTARDLPEHRDRVMHACLRQGMFHPEMMEHLSAENANAADVSLRMVEEADLYLGVFGFRYGYVPPTSEISVTEMEYNRAVERGIPRLIFVMHDSHALHSADVETGEGAAKLEAFKERLLKDRSVCFFRSADELLALVIQSLSEFRQSNLASLHYVSEIPSPPNEYIAHPYTLLQTRNLIGRRKELRLLNDWILDPYSEAFKARVLSFVAIGGIGKSALTWKWFNDIASEKSNNFAGCLWWSFYESDATFENFVIRALAYVTKRRLEEIESIPGSERENQLLAAFDRERFLIVLDGFERILVAYARMDAAHLADDEYDKQIAGRIAEAYHLPTGAADAFMGEHTLRKAADPRVGIFLRKLSRVRATRVVITTRLYPADLQSSVNNEPLPGCIAFLPVGLGDDDAVDLWRAFGVSGERKSLLRLFNLVDNHPLLIQALASEVARDRRSPGDFDRWRRAHPDFDPFRLPLIQVKSHVLEFALRGLDAKTRETLRVVAAFRMPVPYDTLAALLIDRQVCADDEQLDWILTELEDRGLMGWDKRGNRYDLHPIVRGVVWSALDDSARHGVYSSLQAHFEALPIARVTSLADLTPAIELYNTLIGLKRYDDAYILFRDRLSSATLFNVNANAERVMMLEMLFPDGLEQLPRLSDPNRQAFTLNALALAHLLIGQPSNAAAFQLRANNIGRALKREDYVCVGSYNLANAARLAGKLRQSESAGRMALRISREGSDLFQETASLKWLGAVLLERSNIVLARNALMRALTMARADANEQIEGTVWSLLASAALKAREADEALKLSKRAWRLALVDKLERDLILADRLQAESALELGEFHVADDKLHRALTRSREINLVQEEVAVLVVFAEMRRRQKQLRAAREFLDDLWDLATRGPYPLFHADAFNVLAQIERDEGNTSAAVEAATKAYRLAWCDGPPFAYHWGLEKAKQHLKELGAPAPEMPAFDESKFEPMTEVEINPHDEFYVDESAESE